MKKSRRKDVLIARIIFAVVCVLLILIIAGIVVLIRGRLDAGRGESQSQTAGTQMQETQTQGSEQGEQQPEQEPQPSQAGDTHKVLRTTSDVRLRSEPNTDCEVITVLDAGTMLEMLGEEPGWALVDYQGQTGYVSTDYVEEVTGAESGGEADDAE